MSQRRACRALGQPRRTQRYEPKRRGDEGKLTGRMLELVRVYPRYGYRRIWAMLRSGGWRVNRKRIWRLWKLNGLKVPKKQHKKRRLGSGGNGVVRQRAMHKDHVWAWDFIYDRSEDGGGLKWLSIVDEYTRECLALEVARSMSAADVVDVLIELTQARGVPKHIRSDNGPEFIARTIRSWLDRSKIGSLYIEPGSPWQNGYAESFHARLRDELLNAEVFANVAEARRMALRWRLEYNHRRPHSALKYQTPAAFAAVEAKPTASLAAPPPGATPRAADQPAKPKELILS